jgi:hypothetical protein
MFWNLLLRWVNSHTRKPVLRLTKHGAFAFPSFRPTYETFLKTCGNSSATARWQISMPSGSRITRITARRNPQGRIQPAKSMEPPSIARWLTCAACSILRSSARKYHYARDRSFCLRQGTVAWRSHRYRSCRQLFRLRFYIETVARNILAAASIPDLSLPDKSSPRIPLFR